MRSWKSQWPKVCILWAAMSVSAYAEEVHTVVDVCDALRPCIVKLNTASSGRVVSCEGGKVHYKLEKAIVRYGYPLGEFHPYVVLTAPFLLDQWSTSFGASVGMIDNDFYAWGKELRACIGESLPEGYTIAVSSEIGSTGSGQSDAKGFQTSSGGFKAIRPDRIRLTPEQRAEFKAVAQGGYPVEQISHIQLGLFRIFFADNAVYSRLTHWIDELWRNEFPNAVVTPTKRHPPRYQRLFKAEKDGDDERFAKLHVSVSLNVAVQLPKPDPKPELPKGVVRIVGGQVDPVDEEEKPCCSTSWEPWIWPCCCPCDRGVKPWLWPPCFSCKRGVAWLWPPCCKGPAQILWPPCWPNCDFTVGRSTSGIGVLSPIGGDALKTFGPIPFGEIELPIDIDCIGLRFRSAGIIGVGYHDRLLPQQMVFAGGIGLRGRREIAFRTYAIQIGGEVRWMYIRRSIFEEVSREEQAAHALSLGPSLAWEPRNSRNRVGLELRLGLLIIPINEQIQPTPYGEFVMYFGNRR